MLNKLCKFLRSFVIIGLGVSLCSVGYTKLLYYTECTPDNNIKDYYKQILSSDKFQIPEEKLKKIDIYSKKVTENLCIYYIDNQMYNLQDSEMFYLFSDGKYVYPSVVDLNNNVELKSLMRTKLEKYNMDHSSGISLYNKTSDNNVGIFLSLECPYCGYMYQFIVNYFDFAENQNIPVNGDIGVFLMSNDTAKTEFFTKLANTDKNLFKEILYDYFSNQLFKNTTEQLKERYSEYLEKVDLSKDVSKEVKNMFETFNKLNVRGTPATVINGRLIVGANMGLFSYVLKEEKIADIEEITNKMKEYNAKVQAEKNKEKE